MRYAETYTFAVKRLRVKWWRLLWVLAATLEVEDRFGIRCAPRYTALDRLRRLGER